MEEFRWVAVIELACGSCYFVGPYGRLVKDVKNAVCHVESEHLYNQIKQWQPELTFSVVATKVNIKEHS